MPVRLYNTLTRHVDELPTGGKKPLGIYCCGPTVYDVPHVGHARAALAPDLLVRRLRSLGVAVTYVRNITDVDDKILERSQKNGESPLDLSRRMAGVYQEQMARIGCTPPDHEPRVSEHVEQIHALITKLIEQGSAYVVDMPGGTRDVYFAVRSFAGYGKLSGRRLDDLLVGARVEKDENKRDPLDFALWKGALPEQWGWESPWGRGRPGWHIECSAMGTHLLGHGFDVHAGGMDLIFPHHENEIAQSEAACPECGPYARIWMHNGFVNADKEKMSKSLGNFVTVSDVFERNDPEAFRWFLLGAQYRGPIQFETDKLADGRVIFPGIDEAERRVDYLYAALQRLRALAAEPGAAGARSDKALDDIAAAALAAAGQIGEALDDDLNTPVALAKFGELVGLGNDLADLAHKRRKDAAFVGAAAVLAARLLDAIGRGSAELGVLGGEPRDYFERTRVRRLALRKIGAEEIEGKLEERRQARAAKDFAAGDRIRDELAARGVALKDSAEGTTWSVEQ